MNKAIVITMGLAAFALLVYAVWTSDAGSAVEIGLLK